MLVLIWLPVQTLCENWASKFSLPDKAKKVRGLQKSTLHPIHRAIEFQKLLDEGTFNNRAELARNFKISRARVTQLLELLNLEPKVKTHLLALRDTKSVRIHSERKLRLRMKK